MSFDKDQPVGSDPIRTGDNDIRANNLAVETAVDSEHLFDTDGAQTGYHRQGSGRAFSQAVAPALRIDSVHFTDDDRGSLWTDTDDNMLSILTAPPSWTEVQPVGDVNEYWYSLACDSDGSHLIVGAYNDYLYTSNDYGVTWTKRKPVGDVDKRWTALASDSDGSNLIAAHETNGRLYTSDDYGVTWTERQPVGDVERYWHSVASSSDGSFLIATIWHWIGEPVEPEDGRIYISSDSGATWAEVQPAGDVPRYWNVACDSDGSHLIAVSYGGRVYISSDSGTTWTETQPAGDVDEDWFALASDSDGSYLIVGAYNGRLYISSDSGATWTETQPAGDVDEVWQGAACDSDGSHLIVGAYGYGRLYISTDSGTTWTETQPAGDADKQWRGVACDSNGSFLMAIVYGGRIYIFS